MADEKDVEVPEEGVVEINLEDVSEDQSGAPTEAAAEPAAEPKLDKQPRKRPNEDEFRQEAAKTLQEALDPYKRRAEAAEATAQSERQRAEEALRRSQVREAELQTAQEQIQAGQLARFTEGVDNAERLLKSLEAEAKAALNAGEFEKVAEIGTKQARAAAMLDRLLSQKEELEAGRLRQPTHEGRVEPAERQTVSTFERYVSSLAPAAQTWLRAHPECVPPEAGGQAVMNSKMMAGHYQALAQGFAPNSDDYFRVIEESTGHRKKADTSAAEEPAPKPAAKQTPRPSAPPSRQPPGTPQTGGMRTVRLNKDEQETARISFPHLKNDQERFAEYARNKLELEAEGKLGRTTH